MTFKVIFPLKKTLFSADAAKVVATATYSDLATAEKAVVDLFTTEQSELAAAAKTLSASSDLTMQKVGAYLEEEATEVGYLLNQKFTPTLDGKGSLFIGRRGFVSIEPVA